MCASDYAVVKFDSKYYITRTFFIFCYVSLCFVMFFHLFLFSSQDTQCSFLAGIHLYTVRI